MKDSFRNAPNLHYFCSRKKQTDRIIYKYIQDVSKRQKYNAADYNPYYFQYLHKFSHKQYFMIFTAFFQGKFMLYFRGKRATHGYW